MTDSSKALSIIAYYLSEFDMGAVQALGFATQKEAFKQISICFNRDNNYLKLRRDEFDALPDSSSHRKGWRNRPAAKDVLDIAAYLKHFSFDELTDIVQSMIKAQNPVTVPVLPNANTAPAVEPASEFDLENLINFQDTTADIRVKTSPSTVRVYNTSIIRQLKKLYHGSCQLCGRNPFPSFGIDISEVHHIDYFSTSRNNNTSNLIVVCPNHHRLIHKLNPACDKDALTFVYPNGITENVVLNYHL